MPATANPLTPEAARQTLEHYAERHPRTWRVLEQAMSGALGTPDLQLPMLRLTLTTGG